MMQTPDTTAAIKAIMPIAEALGVSVSVSQDGKSLVCDYAVIGISGNSTLATIMEFVGYLMVRFWMRNYDIRFEKRSTRSDVIKAVTRYWIKEES